MTINKTSKIVLVPIEYHKDRTNYIVKDKTSGEFYEMPEMAIRAIKLLMEGHSLNEVERRLKTAYPEKEVDIVDFAHQLIELNLVSEIDGVKVSAKEYKTETKGFMWIPVGIGKLAFNKVSYIIYSILFVFNIFLFIRNPSLFPSYKDYFVFDWMSLNVLLWIAVGMILLLIHESGHILAMRSYNLPTRLSIGHRLMFLALETDMEGTWGLSPAQRNVLYLGGLCLDLVILTFALTVQAYYLEGPMLLLAIMKIIVIDIFIRFVFQCGVFMKTDLYFVLENITGSYNLMENAHHLIKSWFKRTTRKVGEVSYEHEKKTIAFYSIIYFLGVFLTISIFVLFSIPQIFITFSHSIERLGSPLFSKEFLDGAIVLLQTMTGLSLLLYSWNKKYRLGKD
ncbi:hypothetical protein D1B31_07200 [Neobacillus notoginsengisoli]|uniref:Uncharacterized protein n=1 Tax=Neobacillus notoginsengisoli TaxID=1578198 RepID=A0A417YVU5_9BACI|nr:hypothetical protein [Neobacillus notoginsengisoli]RHW41502.1 hypothetical protein D1B31_07200 [Neobacillus notoginsengisoli]